MKEAANSICVNSFHWFPINLQKQLSGARLYMALQFVMRDYKYYGSPFYQGGVANYLELDKYLIDAKRNGIDILLCLNQSPTDVAMLWGGDPEAKPINPNDDPLKPESYLKIGRFFFNMAARYGKVIVDHSRLEVNDEIRWNAQNQIKSGLNLLNRLELWNEQWAWWRGDDSKFTPEEYAVMYSVCYDGHMNQFPNCGVTQADSSFELVMGGMSEMNEEHLNRFLAHLQTIRHDPNIIKYVQFHHYCNTGLDKPDGYTPGQWTQGQCPEKNHLEDRLQKMIDWRDRNQPGAKLIYGEFGYDSALEGQSWQKSHGEINQGNWLVRTYLLGLKKGINEMYAFNSIDGENYASGSLWATAGLNTSESTGFQPKYAMYAVTDLARSLDGFKYVKDVSLSHNVRILLFKNGRTLKYYYWTVEGIADIVIGNTKLVATEQPKYRTVRAYEPNRIKLIKANDNTASSR